MKISKTKLKQIIKEELQSIYTEKLTDKEEKRKEELEDELEDLEHK
jgi:hypothetical protein